MGDMEKQVDVINTKGLHARAAAKFVKLAETYDAVIHVKKDNTTVNGLSIMSLLMLGAAKGARITISANGPDQKPALDALANLVRQGFGED